METMYSQPIPKAFVSHASEDKDRFVVQFATNLRAHGVDVWLDRWEIKAGDSLVQTIFEEGIKSADVFIIVISSVSVTKPWVREELDAGMVRKIAKCCRLIPVVIDACDVPGALKHLKWVCIRDTASYEKELSEILAAIFGASDKPPLGDAPSYARTAVVDYLPDLTKADLMVFDVFCRRYLTNGNLFIQTGEVYQQLMSLGLSEAEVEESLLVLEGRGHLTLEGRGGGHIYAANLQTFSLDLFMRAEYPNYDRMCMDIISAVVNGKLTHNVKIKESTGIPAPIINHFMELLCQRGLVELENFSGMHVVITSISPELKRMLG